MPEPRPKQDQAVESHRNRHQMFPLAQIVTVLLDGLYRKLGATLPSVGPGFGIGSVGTIDRVFPVTIEFRAPLATFIG